MQAETQKLKLTKRERKILSQNRADMKSAPIKRDEIDPLTTSLAHVVGMKTRYLARRNWQPGQPVDRVHRFLLNLADQLFRQRLSA